jgi:ABC-type branched-subunit amino acid transport system ATPase component
MAEPISLEVEQLVVRFGGTVAVDHVNLHVPAGRVTGLIGPNGAGKTTTFNACTGLRRPEGGQVRLAGRDVTSMAPQHRAQLGLGRTFQRMQLFESVTVADNVALGLEARLAGNRPLHHLWSPRSQTARIRSTTRDALELCGITDLASRPVAGLSTGERRLVELARVVAGGFELLLLDEPSSGLDVHETEAFATVLRTLVTQRGVGILLVEHDMSLVMSVCEHLFVIDFGKPVFEGSPAQVRASDLVRAAYLGEEAA